MCSSDLFSALFGQPIGGGGQRFGAGAAQAGAAGFFGGDQGRSFQHAKMAQDGGQGEACGTREIRHGHRPLPQLCQHGPAGGIGKCLEDQGKIGVMLSHVA